MGANTANSGACTGVTNQFTWKFDAWEFVGTAPCEPTRFAFAAIDCVDDTFYACEWDESAAACRLDPKTPLATVLTPFRVPLQAKSDSHRCFKTSMVLKTHEGGMSVSFAPHHGWRIDRRLVAQEVHPAAVRNALAGALCSIHHGHALAPLVPCRSQEALVVGRDLYEAAQHTFTDVCDEYIVVISSQVHVARVIGRDVGAIFIVILSRADST